MVQIKIIRHSERLDYTYPWFWILCFGQYWADPPLTSRGYVMANDKGKLIADGTFEPKFIYTSPYTRTLSTSTEIKTSFPKSKIIIEPLLSEYQPNYKHSINLYPAGIPTTFNEEVTAFSYPESYQNFSNRIQFIVGKLMEKNTEDFIVCTHGEVLKVYIEYIQKIFPDVLLDAGSTPYLTVLSFEYENGIIIKESIKIQ